VAELKAIARAVLGNTASAVLLGRVDRTLEAGAASAEALSQACARVEKMVALFIGAPQARDIAQRFRECLDRAALGRR
jgi:hypothetical protein